MLLATRFIYAVSNHKDKPISKYLSRNIQHLALYVASRERLYVTSQTIIVINEYEACRALRERLCYIPRRHVADVA